MSRPGLGWLPDLPDKRDQYYALPLTFGPLPLRADLRDAMPAVYDQGTLGSCTAQAVAGAIEHGQRKQGIAEGTPSRLFVYYNTRARIGTTTWDSGGYLRDAIKSVAKEGECDETLWPYYVSLFNHRPRLACYDAAKSERVLRYRRLRQQLPELQHCLASGYPFVFGFTVYGSLLSAEVARSGVVPMPAPGERTEGGHAVMAVGYDTEERVFFVRNSWGASWGQRGYCVMPFDYVLDQDLAADFWTIEQVQ